MLIGKRKDWGEEGDKLKETRGEEEIIIGNCCEEREMDNNIDIQ